MCSSRRNSFVGNEETDPKDEKGALLEASKAILQRCESRNDQTKTNGLLQGIKTGIGMVVEQRRLSTAMWGENEGGNRSR